MRFGMAKLFSVGRAFFCDTESSLGSNRSLSKCIAWAKSIKRMAPRFCTAGPFLFGGGMIGSTEATSAPLLEANLSALSARPIDVLVIGGGIVGAGVARDAAMGGLNTVLVEQGDFASGTSSRS